MIGVSQRIAATASVEKDARLSAKVTMCQCVFFSVDGGAYLSLDNAKLLSGLQGLAFGESFYQNVDGF